MLDGVDRREFAEQTGFELDELVGRQLPKLLSLGLLKDEANRLRLTRDGLMVSDSIWPYFL
jgi:coproporphyrinogen III oxidase-like Fe-S oxidoreductase